VYALSADPDVNEGGAIEIEFFDLRQAVDNDDSRRTSSFMSSESIEDSSERPEPVPASASPPSTNAHDLAKELLEWAGPGLEERARRDQMERQGRETLARLARVVSIDIGDKVRREGFEQFFANRTPIIHRFFPKVVPLDRDAPDIVWSEPRGFALVAKSRRGTEVLFQAEIMVTLYGDGQVDLDGQYAVAELVAGENHLIGPDQVGGGIRRRTLVGADEEMQAVADIERYFIDHLDEALKLFVDRGAK